MNRHITLSLNENEVSFPWGTYEILPGVAMVLKAFDVLGDRAIEVEFSYYPGREGQFSGCLENRAPDEPPTVEIVSAREYSPVYNLNWLPFISDVLPDMEDEIIAWIKDVIEQEKYS